MRESAFFGILLATAGYWMLASVLLRLLRTRHPAVFISELGAPTLRQLFFHSIPSRSRWALQWRYMKFILFCEFFRLRDPLVLGVGVAALVVAIITFGFLLALMASF